MDLTTRERVKTLLDSGGISTGTGLDTTIDQLITAYSASFEQYMDRHVESTSRTEYFDLEPGENRIELKGWPISSITSVKNDVNRDFSGSAIDTGDYYANTTRGTIEFDQWNPWYGPGVLQVVYTGGMASSAANFITSYPAIAQALDMQVSYVLRRRDRLGSTALAVADSSVQYQGEVGLLAEVKRILDPYRRFSY